MAEDHTGFSPPQTSGGFTESSGSITVQALASKVLRMAAEIDSIAHASQPRASVAAAAAPRKEPNPFRDAFRANVASEGIPGNPNNNNPEDAIGHSPPRCASPVPSQRSAGTARTLGHDSIASEARLLQAAHVLQREQELAEIVLKRARVEAQLTERRSARGSQASSASQRLLTASAVRTVESPEPLQARVGRALSAAASHEVPTLPEYQLATGLPAAAGAPLPIVIESPADGEEVPRQRAASPAPEAGVTNVFMQTNVRNETHVDNSLNVLNQAHIVQQAQAEIQNVHVQAAAHVTHVEYAATQEIAASNTKVMQLQEELRARQAQTAYDTLSIQQVVHQMNEKIAALERTNQHQAQLLADAEVIRTSHVQAAYAHGLSQQKQSTDPGTTSIGTAAEHHSIATPSQSVADANSAKSDLFGNIKASGVSPAAAGITLTGVSSAAAGAAASSSKDFDNGMSSVAAETALTGAPSAAAETIVPRPLDLPNVKITYLTNRPADLPRSSSDPDLYRPADVVTRVATTTAATASTSQNKREKDRKPPSEKDDPSQRSSPPAGGGSNPGG